ncbi:MAG: hypothetical protein AB4058_00020 [Microcystaceae cyanobacterium]
MSVQFGINVIMLWMIQDWLRSIEPILAPICFVLAWIFIMTLASTLWGSLRDVTNRAKSMHQIPCTNCRFFTNDYRLKCTVQPNIANTEQAIDCHDFSAKGY